MKPKANNCHINPVLYAFYLRLKDTLGAEIVHRRKRKSNTCIEVVFYNELYKYLKGRLNTLKEAEECGYWVICRVQTKRGYEVYHGRQVFQLYLSPVHPKKRREAAHLIEMTEEITFKPIFARHISQRLHRSSVRCSLYGCTSARPFPPRAPLTPGGFPPKVRSRPAAYRQKRAVLRQPDGFPI